MKLSKILLLALLIIFIFNMKSDFGVLNLNKEPEVIVVTLTDFESDSIADVTDDLKRLHEVLEKEKNTENRREVIEALNGEIERGEQHLEKIVNQSISDANESLAEGGKDVVENINEFIDGSDYLSDAKDYITSIDGETVDGWVDSLRDIVGKGNQKLQEIYEENVGGSN